MQTDQADQPDQAAPAPAVTSQRLCAVCRGPLPKGRRSYCGDRCARRGRRRLDSPADYLAFVRRVLDKLGPNVGHADVDELRQLAALRGDLDAAMQAAVDGLRADGYTWQSIGDALGVTRQAALMRFGRKQGRWSSEDRPRLDAGA